MTVTTSVRHRLSAILAADGVGYSRLMARDDVGTVEALDRARAIFRAAIESHQGRVIDMAGDSVLASFETAHGAVEASIAIQATIDAENADIAPDAQLRFRIGIHLGDVIEKTDSTIYGDGVNIAARLEGLAEAGGIVVSQSVYTAVQGRLPNRFEDIGEQTVKNIPQPVRAFRTMAAGDAPVVRLPIAPRRSRSMPGAIVATIVVLAIAAAFSASRFGWLQLRQPTPSTANVTGFTLISIVVLPFANFSGDPSQSYVADGLTASVTADLSRLTGATIISTASALPYRGRPVTLKQIGDELGVRYVLQGNVQRAGDRIRVNAELGDTSTNAQLWSDTFEGDATNLFALQDLITVRISNSVNQQMVISAARDSETRTSNPTVADLLLRARAMSLKPRSEPNSRALLDFYGKAYALDPDNMEAMTGLAFAKISYAANHVGEDRHDEREKIFTEGRVLAQKARDRDPQNPSAWLSLGIDAAAHDDEEGAQRAREARLALQPRTPGSYANLAFSFIEKDPRKAVELLNRAYELSPRVPPEQIYLSFGEAYFRLGEYDKSIEWLLKDADSKRFWQDRIYAMLAMDYAQKGDQETARKWAAAYAAARRPAAYGWLKPSTSAPASVRTYWETTLLPAWQLAGLPVKDLD